jgi:hypothetical protein
MIHITVYSGTDRLHGYTTGRHVKRIVADLAKSGFFGRFLGSQGLLGRSEGASRDGSLNQARR